MATTKSNNVSVAIEALSKNMSEYLHLTEPFDSTRDYMARFNTEVINRQIPYSFEFVSKGPKEAPYWTCILTVKCVPYTSGICKTKKEAKKEAVAFYFQGLPDSQSNDRKGDRSDAWTDLLSSDDEDDVCVTIDPKVTALPRKFARPEMNAQSVGSNSTGPMTNLQYDHAAKTVLISQRDESITFEAAKPEKVPRPIVSFGDQGNVFGALCNRWTCFGITEWGLTDPMYRIIERIDLPFDPLTLMEKNPTFAPFLQYAFVRPQITLKFQMNSTRFHQGKLIVGVRYGSVFDTDDLANEVNHAAQLVQMNHIILSAADSNIAELNIPFVSQFDMINIRDTEYSAPLYYATVYVGILAPLRTGENNTPRVTYAKFIKFSCNGLDTEFYGQRHYLPIFKNDPALGRQYKRIARPEGGGMSRMIVEHVMPDAREDFKTKVVEESAGQFWQAAGALEGMADMFGPEAAAIAHAGTGIFEKMEPRPTVEEVVEDDATTTAPKFLPGAPNPNVDKEKIDPGFGATAKTSPSLGKMPRANARPEMNNGKIVVNPVAVQNWSGPQLSTGHNIQYTRPLRLDNTASIRRGSGLTPPEMVDQFNFNYIKRIWGYIGYFQIKTAFHQAGSLLFSDYINPIKSLEQSLHNPPGHLLPPVSAISNFFEYYSGDLELRIMAVKSPIHSFRLALGITPDVPFVGGPDGSMTFEEFESIPKVVMDFQEGDCYDITIPYQLNTKVAPICNLSLDGDMALNELGYYGIWLESDVISMESLSSVIDVLLFIRAAPNFSWHIPCESRLLTLEPSPEVSKEAQPEMEERSVTDARGVAIHSDRSYGGVLHFGEVASMPSLAQRFNAVYKAQVELRLLDRSGPEKRDTTELWVNDTKRDYSNFGDRQSIVYTEFDVTFNSPYKRVPNNLLKFRDMLHDGFRFSKGSMRYQLVVQSPFPVRVTVVHFPYSRDSRQNDKWAIHQSLDYAQAYGDDYGTNLAKETLVSNQQVIIPFEVPYTSPLKFLVNKYNPAYAFYLGPASYANGFIRIILDMPSPKFVQGSISQPDATGKDKITGVWCNVLLYNAIAPDTKMYMWQGLPWYTTTYSTLDGSGSSGFRIAAFARSFKSTLDTIQKERKNKVPRLKYAVEAKPEMSDAFEHDGDCPWSNPKCQCGPDTCVCCYRNMEERKDMNLILELTKAMLATKDQDEKKGIRALRRNLQVALNKKRKARKEIPKRCVRAEPEMMRAAIDKMDSAIDSAMSSPVMQSRGAMTMLGVASALPCLDTIAKPALAGAAVNKAATALDTATESLTGAVDGIKGNLSSFFESIPTVMSEATTKLASTFGDLLNTANVNLVSAFSHLYNLFKSTQMDVRVSSFIGLLSSIGIVTSNLFWKGYQLLFNLISTRTGYAVPENDGPCPNTSWLGFVFAGLAGFLGYSSSKTNTMFGKLKDSVRDFFYVGNQAHLFFTNQLEYIKHCIYWIVGWEHPEIEVVKEFKLSGIDIEQWAREVLDLTASYRKADVMNDPQLQLRLCDLKDMGDKIMVCAEKVDATRFRTIGIVYKRLSELYDTLGLKINKYGKLEPICIWMSGVPGVGKSALAKKLAIQLCTELGVVHNGDPVYVRNPADPFWSEYHKQPIVNFDDFGVIRDPTILASVLQDYMQICSPVAYAPKFADTPDKGTIVAPVVLIINSNQSHPSFNQMANMESFLRRRDIVIHAVFAEWFKFKYPGIINLKDERIEQSDWDKISRQEHLMFYILDPLEADCTDGPLNANALIKKYFPKLVEIHQRRKAYCEQESRLDRELSVDAWLQRNGRKAEVIKMRQVIQERIDQLTCDNIVQDRQAEKDEKAKQDVSFILNEAVPECNNVGTSQFDFCGDYYCPKLELECGCNARNIITPCTFQVNRGHARILQDPWQTAQVNVWQKVAPNGEDISKCCMHDYINPENADWCPTHNRFILNEDSGSVCMAAEICSDVCILKDPARGKAWFRTWFERAHDIMKTKEPWRLVGIDRFSYPKCLDQVSIEPQNIGIMQRIKNTASWIYNISCDIASYLTSHMTLIISTIGIMIWCLRMYQLYSDPAPEFKAARLAAKVNGDPITHSIFSALFEPEILVSQDVVTSKAANARINQVAGRLAKAQGGYDISRTLFRNTVHFYFNKASITGIGLRGRTCLVPYHAFARYGHVEEVKICVNGTTDVGGMVSIPMENLKVIRLEECDMAIVELPKKLPNFRNIMHLLADLKDIKRVGTRGTLIHSPLGQISEQKIIELDIKRVCENVHYKFDSGDIQESRILGWNYGTYGVGMCGSILVDVKHQKFIAMHVASMDGYGYSQCLAQSMFKDYVFPDCPEDVIETVKSDPDLSSVTIAGDFVPITSLAQDECATLATKTQIVKSVCYEILAPASRFPVDMSTPGEIVPGVTKLAQSVEKGTNPTKSFPKSHMDTVFSWLEEEMVSKCVPICEPKSIRSFQEATFGIDGVTFMDPIKLDTSPGYPLNVICKGAKKVDLVKFDEQPGRSRTLLGFKDELVKIYKVNHENRKKNILPESLYYDFLKDERLKQGKAPRLIQGCPFDETLEWRRYTMDFFAAFQTAGREVGSGIGMNVRSLDTDRLVKKLLEKSPYILTADYKAFGPGLDSELVVRLADVVNVWYKKHVPGTTTEHDRVRRLLFEGLAHSRHVVHDLVIEMLCGSPSGNPFTAPINTLVNKLYIMLSWYGIFKNNPSMRNFKAFIENVYMCAYGDDFIAAVHPDVIDRFNNKTIANYLSKFGIIMTDATNKEGEMREYCSIEEATFLKHYFLRHPDRSGIWMAALEKSVIEDIPSWIRNPCPDPILQAQVNCDQAVRFAYSWGRDYYEHVVSQLRDFWNARGVIFAPLSWYDIDCQCFEIDKGINQVSEDLKYLDKLFMC